MKTLTEDQRPVAPVAEPWTRDQRAGHDKPSPDADQAEGVLRRLLRAGYSREKAAIRSAKASASKSVQQSDQEAIVTLRNRTKRIFNARVRTLQARHVNQLGDLENKLNAGRAAITRMPESS